MFENKKPCLILDCKIKDMKLNNQFIIKAVNISSLQTLRVNLYRTKSFSNFKVLLQRNLLQHQFFSHGLVKNSSGHLTKLPHTIRVICICKTIYKQD